MHEVQLGPTAQKLLEFLRAHPTDRFTVEELAEQTDSTLTQIRAALETLASHNFIDHISTSSGKEAFMYRRP